MKIVRVVPSAEDEVNCACFHPAVGGGLAYGTKEGRLRIVTHDRFVGERDDKPPPRGGYEDGQRDSRCLEDDLLETECYVDA